MSEKKISEFVVDNLRLQELAIIVEKNKPFYDAFLNFLKTFGFADVAAFVHEANSATARSAIEAYLANPAGTTLYDGLGREKEKGDATLSYWIQLQPMNAKTKQNRICRDTASHHSARKSARKCVFLR